MSESARLQEVNDELEFLGIQYTKVTQLYGDADFRRQIYEAARNQLLRNLEEINAKSKALKKEKETLLFRLENQFSLNEDHAPKVEGV